MSIPDTPAISLNACVSCKAGKRKCNRHRPTCSTCARVGRTCHYEEDSADFLQGPAPFRSQSYPATSEDDGFATSHASSNSGYSYSPERTFNSPAVSVDPFRHEALRQPTVTVALSAEATRIIGSSQAFHAMASKYFEGPGCRLPIISQGRFFERLPTVLSNPQADFILLCLAMHLLSQAPSHPGQNMQTSVYVSVKSHISLLEATSFLSLEVMQARLLVTFYEMGHGINPAASVSIAACAQMARLLGLNKKRFQTADDSYAAKIVAEEEKRVWWAVVNLDRYINLLNGDSLFHTEDLKADDYLPIDDTMWAQNMIPDTDPLNLTTPSNVLVGPFARECQISHLIGRVLRHVFEPSSDSDFHLQEALQLERTLMAFMPLLIEEQTKFHYYCAALGMCSSALFILYESTILTDKNSSAYQSSILESIETTSTRIAEFSRHLFGNPDAVNFDTTSPVVMHSLYQAAIVQLQVLRKGGEIRNQNALEGLKTVLGYFNRRWSMAGRYLEVLEGIGEEVPCAMLPVNGSYVSGNFPGG